MLPIDHGLLERASAWANSEAGRASMQAQREELRAMLALRSATKHDARQRPATQHETADRGE